jgi:hypothetical protein
MYFQVPKLKYLRTLSEAVTFSRLVGARDQPIKYLLPADFANGSHIGNASRAEHAHDIVGERCPISRLQFQGLEKGLSIRLFPNETNMVERNARQYSERCFLRFRMINNTSDSLEKIQCRKVDILNDDVVRWGNRSPARRPYPALHSQRQANVRSPLHFQAPKLGCESVS